MVYSRKICYTFTKSIILNGEHLMNTTVLDRERLIACRKKLGLTKQEAAIQMQLSQPAYLRYESGERTPSIHVIYYMAHVLGTSADYLTGKTGNPNPDTYVIHAHENSELFTFIETYKCSNSETQQRLLSYLSKLDK